MPWIKLDDLEPVTCGKSCEFNPCRRAFSGANAGSRLEKALLEGAPVEWCARCGDATEPVSTPPTTEQNLADQCSMTFRIRVCLQGIKAGLLRLAGLRIEGHDESKHSPCERFHRRSYPRSHPPKDASYLDWGCGTRPSTETRQSDESTTSKAHRLRGK